MLAVVAISLTACEEEIMDDRTVKPSSIAVAPAVASRMRADLATVANARVYFGHQSVGANILDGLRELSAVAPAPKLAIIGTRNVGSIAAPALVEFAIGENGDPMSKARDFAAALDNSRGNAAAIALFKYCYLDLTPHTDVAELFSAHRDGVRALQGRHPEITFVHVTAPLTTVETGPKLLLKRLLGKPSSRDANRKRNEFNDRVRREFQGEPIFDLARIESTRPDGSRAFFVTGGDTVYTLAPELTDDGGHLNAAGRRAAAIELVSVLAAAASSPARGDRNARR